MIEFNGLVGNMVGYKGRDGRNVLRFAPWKIRKSMTYALQLERVLLANVINIWKAFKGSMDGCFQTKKRNQSDYNRFVQVNMGKNNGLARVCLKKGEVADGACVVQELQVSEGVLEPIEVSVEMGGKMRSDLSLGELELTAETTVQQFASAIINNNPNHDFQEGDNIACFILTQRTSGSDNLPRVRCTKSIVTLDLNDTRVLYNMEDNGGVVNPTGFGVVDGNLGTKSAVNGGIFWLHTRTTPQGKLVSTQRIVANNDILTHYIDTAARNRAIASYGGYKDTFLYPVGTTDEPAMP